MERPSSPSYAGGLNRVGVFAIRRITAFLDQGRRMRKLSALLLAGLFLLAVVGCSTKSNEDVSAGSTTTDSQDDDDGDETTTTRRSSGTTDDDGSGPDIGDLPVLGDCLEVSLAYAGLFLGSAFASDEDKAELEQQLDEIKGQVPEDIQDDMDTIANGMANADGIIELGEFLDSDEYKEADANIKAYFETTCDLDDGSEG